MRLLTNVKGCYTAFLFVILSLQPVGKCADLNLLFCQPTKQQFSLLNGNFEAVVGARLTVSTYKKGVTADTVQQKLKMLPMDQRDESPEWLVVREYQYRKAGDIDGVASLYNDANGRDYIRRAYKDVGAMKRYANRVHKLTFIYRAQFGKITYLA